MEQHSEPQFGTYFYPRSIQEHHRFPLLDLFPNASKDSAEKIAFLSHPISQSYQNIHSIYQMVFHQMIEQCYLHVDIGRLQEVKNVLLFGLKEKNLTEEETKQLNSVVAWLEKIDDIMQQDISNHKPSTLSQFNKFYQQTFYADVFTEYSNRQANQNNQLLYPSFSLALSIYLMYKINDMKQTRSHLDGLESQFVFWDQSELTNEHIGTISKERVSNLASILELGLRVYVSYGDTVEVFRKVSSDSYSAIVLVISNSDKTIRIGYDTNIQGLYRLYHRNSSRQIECAKDLFQSKLIQEKQKEQFQQSLQRQRENLEQEIQKLNEQLAEDTIKIENYRENLSQLEEQVNQRRIEVQRLNQQIEQHNNFTPNPERPSSGQFIPSQNTMQQQNYTQQHVFNNQMQQQRQYQSTGFVNQNQPQVNRQQFQQIGFQNNQANQQSIQQQQYQWQNNQQMSQQNVSNQPSSIRQLNSQFQSRPPPQIPNFTARQNPALWQNNNQGNQQ